MLGVEEGLQSEYTDGSSTSSPFARADFLLNTFWQVGTGHKAGPFSCLGPVGHPALTWRGIKEEYLRTQLSLQI